MSDLDARCFIKRGNVLAPADIMADEFMATIRDGREIMVTPRRPRNPKHHRLLFAALKLTIDNTDKWPSVEVLLDDLKVLTGLFETRINALTGIPYIKAQSISFAAMSQDVFASWFDRATFKLAEAIGVEHRDLLAEIAEMTAPRAPADLQGRARAA